MTPVARLLFFFPLTRPAPRLQPTAHCYVSFFQPPMYTLTCPIPGCGKPLKGFNLLYVHFLKGYEKPAEALYCCVQHASHLVSYTGGDLKKWRSRAQGWYTNRFTRDAWMKAFEATRSVYEEMMKQKSERKRKRLKSESVQTATPKERKRKTSSKTKQSKRKKVERKQTKGTPKKRSKPESSTESSAKKKIRSSREDSSKFIISKLEKIIHTLSEITDYLKIHH
jgi:hypothetical protein